MNEPDGYLMVKQAWEQAIAQQLQEFPDLDPPPPRWENLGTGMRDAIGRLFFMGGESAMARFMEKFHQETGTNRH